MNKVNRKGRVASPLLHLTIWFFIFSFISAVVLSFILKVEIVARGEGKIVPISRVQVVQAEFSGKIKEILVRNGDLVEKGKLLIEYDKTEIQAEANKIKEEINRLEIERERIDRVRKILSKKDYFNKNKVARIINEFNALVEIFKVDNGVAYFAEQKALLKAEIAEVQNALLSVNASF